MKAQTALASVHRFGGKVAAYLADGRTVYLSAPDALAFAAALKSCADNISEQPDFVKSNFRTITLYESKEPQA